MYHIDYSDDAPPVDNSFKNLYMKNMERFSSMMSEKNWNSVLHSNNAQDAYTAFNNTFSDVYNTNFPFKDFKRGYLTRKPRLSQGMKTAIKNKNYHIGSTNTPIYFYCNLLTCENIVKAAYLYNENTYWNVTLSCTSVLIT